MLFQSENPKLASGLMTFLNLIERELSPSFMAICFLMSVGGYYAFSVVLTFIMVFTSGFLFMSYKQINHSGIKFSRVLLFIVTTLFFLILLGDNHIFEDSTLPQKIEQHMTFQARARHNDEKTQLHKETWTTIKEKAEAAKAKIDAEKAKQ